MEDFVAQIQWEGLEVATGVCEIGKLLCRVDDIVIVERHTTRGHQLMMEKMRALGPEGAKNVAAMQRITEEIQVMPSANDVVATWFQKSIQLSPKYNLGFSEHPDRRPRDGFGFSGDIGVCVAEPAGCRMTFSWDWFTVHTEGKATKLQESGEISFEEATTVWGPEIVRMVFDTDVSFRIMRQESVMKREPNWRIRVLKGSEICWPSLIEGKNVPNGFVS